MQVSGTETAAQRMGTRSNTLAPLSTCLPLTETNSRAHTGGPRCLTDPRDDLAELLAEAAAAAGEKTQAWRTRPGGSASLALTGPINRQPEATDEGKP